jgi:hypothetical protein
MAGSSPSVRVVKQIQAWRDELIDLSRRNRLLNLNLEGRTTALEILEPELNEVLIGLRDPIGWRFHYPPLSASTEEIDETLRLALEAEDPDLDDEIRDDELVTTATSAPKLSSRLRTMAQKAASEYTDRGLRVLYLTVGMLEWSDGDGNKLTSPLLLVPVVLDRGTPRDPYRLKEADEDWSENPALMVKLQQDYGLALPLMSEAMEVDTYLALVAETVREEGWIVTRRVSIAPLSFAKETMYRDLLENEEAISSHPLIEALALGDVTRDGQIIERIGDSELDAKFPPESLHSILDADSTQRECIIAAKQGYSFVMDGPPGSGKSQTIANIIAELMAAGRSVLFVSEKAAALEVVKKRLDSAHLGEFVLELHSHNAKRKEVATALGQTLLRRVVPPRSPEVSIAALVERRTKLSDYALAANEKHPQLGKSLHDVMGRCGELGESPIAPLSPDIAGGLNSTTIEAIKDAAKDLSNAWGPVDRLGEFMWRDTSELAARRTATQVEADLDEYERRLTSLIERMGAYCEALGLQAPSTMQDCRRLLDLNELVLRRPVVNATWLTADNWLELQDEVGRLELLSSEHRLAATSLDAYRSDWIEIPLDPSVLEKSLAAAASALEVDSIGTWSASTLDQQAETANTAATAIQLLLTDASTLAGLLGIEPTTLTFADIDRLRELVNLSNLENRPERSWIDQQTLSMAQDAIRLVRPLVEEWASLEAQVLQHFNQNITILDVASLFPSPTDLRPNLSRFSSQGRANRKQLAACAASGKVTADAAAALPMARTWQGLTSKISEVTQAQVLGAYFAGPRTDIAAVTEALSAAERALVLAGSGADLERLSAQVSRGSLDTDGLSALASRLVQHQLTWRQRIDAFPQLSVLISSEARISVAVEICLGVSTSLAAAQASVDLVAADRGDLLDDVLSTAQLRTRLQTIEDDFAQIRETERFGESYDGVGTDWAEIREGMGWANEIRLAMDDQISVSIAQELISIEHDPLLLERVDHVFASRNSIIEMFTEPYASSISGDLDGHLDDVIETVQALARTLADLNEWSDFKFACATLGSLGVSECVEFAIRESLPREDLVDLFERTVLRTWVDFTIESDPRCKPQRSADRTTLIETFQDLDRSLAAAAATRVVELCNERRPTTKVGESAILSNEAQKKIKHRPVRDLLAATTRTSQDIKPCFMMSPLAVSQFLPPEMRFDVVIFDEASQVRPCDAINSIYRGKQLIIAGDERQLPPTSFFDKGISDTSDIYDEEELVEFESVLKLAKGAAGIDELPLRWHYRSRHESLITYSNRMFYESQLVTYPSAVDVSHDLGVHFEYVPDGVYARGGSKDNRIEAERVAERVVFHATNHPDLTLGVVAFSEAQASRILYEIEAVRRQRPDLDSYFAEDRLDGFFVKNLESVQGDERDIIIFSIGYGPDEFGKITMAFGPLNKEGGHRRLNVAVTRARRRVEVVTSITAAEFDSASSNWGVKCLRRYLDYAERGIAAFADDQKEGGEPESPFEEDVLRCIQEMGYDVVAQVGQAGYRIDMAVRHPQESGRFVIGIECDGAMYHSSLVARDRDRLRQDVLEGLGWTLHRIWGTSWYRQRAQEKERLRAAIEDAIQGRTRIRASRSKSPQLEAPQVIEVEESLDVDWTTSFRPFIPNVSTTLELRDPLAKQTLNKALTEAVNAMSPVHADLCVLAIRDAWSIKRMTAQNRDAVTAALTQLVRSKSIQRDRFGFYWGMDGMTVQVRVPDPGVEGSARPASIVSPDEIKLAMFRLAKDARTLAPDELFQRVGRLFGWSRTGSEVLSLLDKAFAELKKTRSLISEPNHAGITLVHCWDADDPDLS